MTENTFYENHRVGQIELNTTFLGSLGVHMEFADDSEITIINSEVGLAVGPVCMVNVIDSVIWGLRAGWNFLGSLYLENGILGGGIMVYDTNFYTAGNVTFDFTSSAITWHASIITRNYNVIVYDIDRSIAFSSSIMIVLIATFVGVWDFWSLVTIFTLNAMMIMFGYYMGVVNQHTEKTSWSAFLVGCISGGVPWVVLFAYFVAAIMSTGVEPPAFVYSIFFIYFAVFNVFALNMVLQYKGVGRWRD